MIKDYTNKTINELFERQVNLTPEKIAIVFNDIRISYLELDKEANQVAHMLIENGIDRADTVGIVMNRSKDFIVALLGVLKAGAAYLAIDPKFPLKRMEYMLHEAEVKILITDKNTDDIEMPNCIKKFISNAQEYSQERCTIRNLSDDLMYILYTSGSTGEPKGVMVEHRNVTSYISSFKREFNICNTDNVLQQSTCAFDIFVEEVYPTLLSGATLVIAEDELTTDEVQLMHLLDKENITITSTFPYLLSKLNTVPFEAKSWRLAISGGDVLRPEFVSNLLNKVQIYNTYGPSETTVCASYFRYKGITTKANRIPIGKSIENSQIYIVDENGKQVPDGEIGEISIAGEGISRGYLKKLELTKKTFVFNQNLNKKIYMTGDLGVYNELGEIEFIKRKDNQIMIQGKRVEIGEVENCLFKIEQISNAIVLPLTDDEDRNYLCAYIIENTTIKISNIKEHLSQYLPEFMIPEFFIKMKTVPLTTNGKIDKKSFPIPMI